MATFQVSASTDDCIRYYINDIFSATGANFFAGYESSAAQDGGSAARFLSVTIPAGVTILTAKLVLTCRIAGSNTTVNTRIRAEKAADPATFSDSTDFDARTWTTEYINWDGIGDWTQDVEYDSADFTAVLQEVIDQGGWASGNAVVILWDDYEERSTQANSTTRYAHSYNSDAAKAPKLVVTYTLPIEQAVGGGSIAIAGSLSFKFVQAVGSGSIAIAGSIGERTKIGVDVGFISRVGS